jgi:hypothetical protein
MIEAGSKIDDGMAISLDGRKKKQETCIVFLKLADERF